MFIKVLSAAIADLHTSPSIQESVPLEALRKSVHERVGRFVYILHHADEVLYVGSTRSSIYKRIACHKSGGKRPKGMGRGVGSTDIGRYIRSEPPQPIFITWLEFGDEDIYTLEGQLIGILKPRFNKFGKTYEFPPMPRPRAV